jgi:hypothetical protein
MKSSVLSITVLLASFTMVFYVVAASSTKLADCFDADLDDSSGRDPPPQLARPGKGKVSETRCRGYHMKSGSV